MEKIVATPDTSLSHTYTYRLPKRLSPKSAFFLTFFAKLISAKLKEFLLNSSQILCYTQVFGNFLTR